MQPWKAIGLVIRWPNLVFIALTQSLSWYCLVRPLVVKTSYFPAHQVLLVLSTVFIAAAGYMINDYFDWQIDTINKPNRVVIGKVLPRRSIILWHVGLNGLALLLVYWASHSLRLMMWQLGSILLLWFYSTTFKRRLFIGNFVVACMTALTVALPALFEFDGQWALLSSTDLLRWVAYVIFAFLVTLIREIVKDIEDIKGDSSQACRTIPLVWGINIARLGVDFIWMLLSLGLVVMGWVTPMNEIMLKVGYGLMLLPIPALVYSMHQANTSLAFGKVSRLIKVYTLLGILTMLLF